MNELKFKTSIMCNHCLGKVSNVLNEIPEITEWEVDLNSDEHILSVKTNSDDIANKIISELLSIGYKAEIIK